MAFKDILVHIDTTSQSLARMELAVNLAKKNRAQLTGLYVVARTPYKHWSENDELKITEMETSFKQKCAQAGISAEWLCIDLPISEVSVTEIVNQHAYHKDLVIVGQTSKDSLDENIPADLPERVVLGSGRPVLIVPYAGKFKTAGDRVMVAWNSGRESTRALNDAMPFLRRAKQVTVLGLSKTGAAEGPEMISCAAVSAQLAHHKITAKIEHLIVYKTPIGDMLLNFTWEEGSDLLVMGAYSHTSQGGLVLGTVAKYVLQHMTLPVLMSH